MIKPAYWFIASGLRELTQELGSENCYIDEFVLMVSQAAHAWRERGMWQFHGGAC